MLQDHLMVYSEPLYLFCGLIGFLLLSRHLETEKLGFLVLSAIAMALAFLSRFVGLSLVIAGGLGILFWSDKSLSKRILHSVLCAIISIAPTAIYLVYRTVAYETATGRTITINYTVSIKTLKSIIWELGGILQRMAPSSPVSQSQSQCMPESVCHSPLDFTGSGLCNTVV